MLSFLLQLREPPLDVRRHWLRAGKWNLIELSLSLKLRLGWSWGWGWGWDWDGAEPKLDDTGAGISWDGMGWAGMR